MHLPGLGPKTARRIWQELGVETLDDLKKAAESRTAPHADRPRAEDRGERPQGARDAAQEDRAQAAARTGAPGGAGGRRSAARAPRRRPGERGRQRPPAQGAGARPRHHRHGERPEALIAYFTELAWVEEIVAKGNTKATVVANDGLRFDLRVVPPDSYGNLLQHFTGSKQHNVALREEAVRRKLSVSEYGIQDTESGEVFTDKTEEAMYERLGYPWIPPELRENMGELQAAREGRLPQLVELADIRGDLHSHSTWSQDGKNTIEEMALEARRLGRSYLVVTDHSHYLREGRIEAQSREIEKVQAKLSRFKLLKGIEANIRTNGEVDVDDDVLAKRDWVMASVHSALDKDLTERVLAAMENPHVDCIGHLTGRKLNRRGPADVDIERVVEKALETGTFLEINAQPDRLDLRDAHARLAGEAGVKIVISSDAHEIPRAVEPRVRRRSGAPGLARAGADPEHAALGFRQEAAQEVKYRAVIFDLWQTLVPWDVVAATRFYDEMAVAAGVDEERFREAWVGQRKDREVRPIADHLRDLFGEPRRRAGPRRGAGNASRVDEAFAAASARCSRRPWPSYAGGATSSA